jgi:hypothetical protein
MSLSVGSGATGPGQTSPGSVVRGCTSTCSPMARRMVSLLSTGMCGLLPVEKGRLDHVA